MSIRTRVAERVTVSRAVVATALFAVIPWSWWLIRDLSPYLELIAIGTPLVVAGAVIGATVLAVMRRSPLAAVAAVSWLVFGLAVIVPPLSPRSGPTPLNPSTIYAINVTGHDGDNMAIADAVEDGDLVVASELTRFLDGRLAERFAHREVLYTLYNETNYAVPDLGVYSRHPITPLESPSWLPGQRVRVDAPSGPFVLYALHVPQPGFSNGEWRLAFPRRERLVERLAAAAEDERLPTVIAGDLNATDRGADYRRFTASFDDAVRTRWAAPTSTKSSPIWRAMLLRIDHILHSPDLCSEAGGRVDLPGSEHRGVRARVGPCPAARSG